MSQWLPSLNPSYETVFLFFYSGWKVHLWLDRGTTKLQISAEILCEETGSCVLLDHPVLSTVDTGWNLKRATLGGGGGSLPSAQRSFVFSPFSELLDWSHGLPTQTERLLSVADMITRIRSRSQATLEIRRNVRKVQSSVQRVPCPSTLTELSYRLTRGLRLLLPRDASSTSSSWLHVCESGHCQ